MWHSLYLIIFSDNGKIIKEHISVSPLENPNEEWLFIIKEALKLIDEYPKVSRKCILKQIKLQGACKIIES